MQASGVTYGVKFFANEILVCIVSMSVPDLLLGSLRPHDEDGNKNPHKFAYLTMKNSIFARFARAFFIF